MVFSFGGKKHHYFQIDKKLSKILESVESGLVDSGQTANDFFAKLLEDQSSLSVETKPKKKVKRRGVKN